MISQSKRLRAGGKVIEDAMVAHERGELSDHVVLGWRLATTALIMKPSHQPGAVKIARDYAEAVGIDFDKLAEQIEARIYEAVQFEGLIADQPVSVEPDFEQFRAVCEDTEDGHVYVTEDEEDNDDGAPIGTCWICGQQNPDQSDRGEG